MTVEQLIKILNQMEPEARVRIARLPEQHSFQISSVEEGRHRQFDEDVVFIVMGQQEGYDVEEIY